MPPRKKIESISQTTYSTSAWQVGEKFVDLEVRSHIIHLKGGKAQFLIVITAPSGAVAEEIAQVYHAAFAKKA